MRTVTALFMTLIVAACAGRPADSGAAPTAAVSLLTTVGDSASTIEGIAEFGGLLYVCDWKDGTIYRIDPADPMPTAVGRLPVAPGTVVLGLRTDRLGNLYLAAPETGRVFRVAVERLGATDFDPAQDAVVFATGADGANALAFDQPGGHLWITGGPSGNLYRVGPAGGAVEVAATGYAAMAPDTTVANRAFTVNGIAISGDRLLFTANTGTGEISRLLVDAQGQVTSISTFVKDDRLVGADGLFMDDQSILWVSANFRNTLARIGPDGTVTIVATSTPDSNGNALRFPAELTKVGDTMYLANLNFPIGANTGQPVPGASVAAVALP
ncbi:MAG TPA: SMP-30/gluconolactonase/LRE family protein [Gemmatimonadales bacterium]|nr:SMP-30/gluconolactonase/LRE family protein [Gemmatimonadales bacterium]